MKHGKKYLESVKLIERNKLYDPDEAVKLALQLNHASYFLSHGINPPKSVVTRNIMFLPRPGQIC